MRRSAVRCTLSRKSPASQVIRRASAISRMNSQNEKFQPREARDWHPRKTPRGRQALGGRLTRSRSRVDGSRGSELENRFRRLERMIEALGSSRAPDARARHDGIDCREDLFLQPQRACAIEPMSGGEKIL